MAVVNARKHLLHDVRRVVLAEELFLGDLVEELSSVAHSMQIGRGYLDLLSHQEVPLVVLEKFI